MFKDEEAFDPLDYAHCPSNLSEIEITTAIVFGSLPFLQYSLTPSILLYALPNFSQPHPNISLPTLFYQELSALITQPLHASFRAITTTGPYQPTRLSARPNIPAPHLARHTVCHPARHQAHHATPGPTRPATTTPGPTWPAPTLALVVPSPLRLLAGRTTLRLHCRHLRMCVLVCVSYCSYSPLLL